METIHFSTIINAPKEKVWQIMLEDATYRQWTEPFHAGSYFEGDWSEGNKMKFLGPNDDGTLYGMFSVIEANRPYEFLSIKHLGEIINGEEKPWTEAEGAGAHENYTFREVDGGTEVLVDLDTTEQYKDMFSDMWPKALAKLKEISEN